MDKALFDQARNYIYADILREINLAKLSQRSQNDDAKASELIGCLEQYNIPGGGANFMVGLALLCYVEFAGKLKFGHKKNNGDDFSSKNFNDFFDLLGKKYQKLRRNHDVYDLLRCGFAHEYYVKGNSEVAMFTKKDVGIWFDDKRNCFVIAIEKFFEDFRVAFDNLEIELFNPAAKENLKS